MYRLYHSFPLRVERIRRYRARKKEISVLSTEKLLEMQKSINASRSVAIAEDDYDEQPDSLYEPPPIDSDEYIISEILKERKTAK